jgi:hypothetical protein
MLGQSGTVLVEVFADGQAGRTGFGKGGSWLFSSLRPLYARPQERLTPQSGTIRKVIGAIAAPSDKENKLVVAMDQQCR